MANRFDTNSSMREEFDKVLKQYGHNVYLQRVDRTIGTCELVWKDELEIHTVRFSLTNNRTLPGAGQENMEGLTSTSERIYYFRYDAQPYDHDRIYELEIAPSGNQSVWQIDTVAPMYGDGGNLVYWMTGATRIRPN